MVLRGSWVDYGQVLGRFWKPLAVEKCGSTEAFRKLDSIIIILYICMVCSFISVLLLQHLSQLSNQTIQTTHPNRVQNLAKSHEVLV